MRENRVCVCWYSLWEKAYDTIMVLDGTIIRAELTQIIMELTNCKFVRGVYFTHVLLVKNS